MTKRAVSVRGPRRGEIWRVNFNSPLSAKTPEKWVKKDQLPTTGDEIFKVRPAVVMNVAEHWDLKLRIVVPVTGWDEDYVTNRFFWMVKIPMSSQNRLDEDSGADTFQVKSVSISRFGEKLGVVTRDELELLTDTVAFCIGAAPLKSSP